MTAVVSAESHRSPGTDQRHRALRSLGERVCMAAVAAGPTYGGAVAARLAPSGDLGRIWSLSAPLVYRALSLLEEAGLVAEAGTEPGRGRSRRMVRATPRGRRQARRWVSTPVEHLRDIRTELLLKLAVAPSLGLDPATLLARQRSEFTPVIEARTRPDRSEDPVEVWRQEGAAAVERFLERALALADQASEPPPMTEMPMQLSARNQLDATVTEVKLGEVMATVRATLPDGQTVSAAITRDSVEELGLRPGDAVKVVIKSTEVMLAKP